MHLGTALGFLFLLASPVLPESDTSCKIRSHNDNFDERCPVEMTSVSKIDSEHYSECITIHVWMKAEDFSKDLKLEILLPSPKLFKPTLKKRQNKTKQNKKRVNCDSDDMLPLPRSNTSVALWELVHNCVQAKKGQTVSVSYSTKSTNCNVTYRVQESVPDFALSVNPSAKSIIVTMKTESASFTTKTRSVSVSMKTESINVTMMTKSINVSMNPESLVTKGKVRYCYQKDTYCTNGSSYRNINTSQSVILTIPIMLPCVCVQVYYVHTDARRHEKCPLQNKSIIDARDVFLSSEIKLYERSLKLITQCPASQLNISASLCWMQGKNFCIPILNSTLKKKDDTDLEYNTSLVDRHPQMCMQFSVQGVHNITCLFKADESSWEVSIRTGMQSILVYITASSSATFSAQLCVLTERGCTPNGNAHAVTMERNTTENIINVPLHFHTKRPCVQVWQSNPAHHGKRIMCPHYMHKRRGLYLVAALIFVLVVVSLGVFIHRATEKGAAGWLCIQRPLLLVCSSDQSVHVSAVCALASILQGELGATVHTALWAQSSQNQNGSEPSVADLGPLPWLYGQWDAVCKAKGKVLIIWSPEATNTYEKWREERANMNKNERKEDYRKADVRHEKTKAELEEDLKHNGRRLVKCIKEKTARKKDCVGLCDDKDWYSQKEPSTVIEPVFTAALGCLERVLQESKEQGVALVYFQGLGHSRDIPKAFRDVTRYCLPQDFRGLIGELGEMRRRTKTGKLRWHCWPRILSKVLAIWLAQKLTQRLQTLVPQMQGTMQSKMSVKMASDKMESRLKPLAVIPGTAQERELLHG